jgi:membrane protease YdiL (CAAX protease family)
MDQQRNWVHWATLLYVVVVIASLPITGTGSAPPAGFDPGVPTIAAQVGLILLPALIFVWLTRQPFRETFKLQRVPFGTAVKSFVLGLACWPISTFLSILAQLIAGLVHPAAAVNPATVTGQGGSPWLMLLAVAVIAPLCEELLFRGVLLTDYEPRFALHSIWLVGILFGFLHPVFDQALGALFVGIMAGWTVYRTRSIWSGVLVHFGVNLLGGLLTLLVSLAVPSGTGAASAAGAGDTASLLWTGMLVWGGIGLLMLIPIVLLLRIVSKRYAPPTWPGARLSFQTLWS